MAMTAESVLKILKEGNQRFVDSKQEPRDLKALVKATSQTSNPFAVILGCFDSRVPHEIIFDAGIGDFFSIRVAGNVVDEDVLGSMEFACKILGIKLIVVLGHSKCQAIKGAIDDVRLGNLTALLAKIKPAIDETKTEADRTSKNLQFVEEVSKQNVFNSMLQISVKSPILNEMLIKGELKTAGALYDIETGKVEFY